MEGETVATVSWGLHAGISIKKSYDTLIKRWIARKQFCSLLGYTGDKYLTLKIPVIPHWPQKIPACLFKELSFETSCFKSSSQPARLVLGSVRNLFDKQVLHVRFIHNLGHYFSLSFTRHQWFQKIPACLFKELSFETSCFKSSSQPARLVLDSHTHTGILSVRYLSRWLARRFEAGRFKRELLEQASGYFLGSVRNLFDI
jgi:hypothetical protein